jgi:hypothetical protein
MDALGRLGCIACAQLGIPNPSRTQIHHILEGNRRLGHNFSIPLCAQHHEGFAWDELWGIIPLQLQVSIADGRKAFSKVYGTERELWEKCQDRLHLSKEWVKTKVNLRVV